MSFVYVVNSVSKLLQVQMQKFAYAFAVFEGLLAKSALLKSAPDFFWTKVHLSMDKSALVALFANMLLLWRKKL